MADFGALEKKYGLPSGLLTAVMQAESGGNPKAVSQAGAQGLFQFMPQTAKAYGIDPLDPEQAAIGAARMYGDLSKQYGGNVDKMLAGYNWGSGNLAKFGLEKAPQETRDYIERVKGALPKQYADSGEIMNDALPEGFQVESAGDELPPGFEVETAQPPKEVPLDTSLGATIRDQFLNAATLGYGAKAQAYLASLAGIPYEDALRVAQGNVAAQQEESPYISTAANVAGSLGGMGALAKMAPGAASQLMKFAQVSPYKAGASIGAVQGAIQGAGGATPEESSAEKALLGGAFGGFAGIGGTYLGRNVVAPLAEKLGETGIAQGTKSALGKMADRLGIKPVSGGKVPAIAPAVDVPEIAPPVKTKPGEIFSKTAGQRTQDPALQRLESEARANLITPQATREILQADVVQNRQYRDFVGKLAGNIDEATDVNALVDGIGETISKKFGEQQAVVSNAYKLANQGKGIKIGMQDIQQGIWKNIVDTRRNESFDVSLMPQAKSVINRLAKYSKVGVNRVTAVKLGELEAWRKMATNAADSTKDPTEGRFLRSMVRSYDDFMQQTAENAADIGDKEAINAFKNAVSSRRELGRLFESNDLVERMAKNKLSVDDARKALMGSGAIKGKSGMAENARALINAAGKDGEAVKADLRQSFMRKAMERATGGFEPGNPDVQMLSAAKLKTELENLFVNQSEFAKVVFGKDAVKEATQAIKELALISSKQASTQNVSGSGELLGRLLKVAGKIPVAGKPISAAQSVVESGKRQQEAQKVISGLNEFMLELNQPVQSPMWAVGGAAGGRAAVQQGEGVELGGDVKREPLRLTIPNPNKKEK